MCRSLSCTDRLYIHHRIAASASYATETRTIRNINGIIVNHIGRGRGNFVKMCLITSTQNLPHLLNVM